MNSGFSFRQHLLLEPSYKYPAGLINIYYGFNIVGVMTVISTNPLVGEFSYLKRPDDTTCLSYMLYSDQPNYIIGVRISPEQGQFKIKDLKDDSIKAGVYRSTENLY